VLGAAVEAGAVGPGDGDAAIGQHRHVGVDLPAAGVRVDGGLEAAGAAVGVEQPQPDVAGGVAAVGQRAFALRVVVDPHHDKAAIGQPRRDRAVLLAVGGQVDRHHRTPGGDRRCHGFLRR
jgi:hypothetical protein